MKMLKWFLILVFLLQLPVGLLADDKEEDEKKEAYIFTIDKEVERTPVKNQYRTGTCWCFATISYLESELLRTGKGEFNLSEMFVVRNTYPVKAMNYIRLHGDANFSSGGQSHDVINAIRNFGIVTEDVYTGMQINEKRHNHGEMSRVLKGMMDGVLKRGGKRVTPRWMDALNAVLDVYLGKKPESFQYKGKNYTPKRFAEYLGFNWDDYIELTSYSHHPFYEQCRLEIPDNWDYNSDYYNVPIDDLEAIIDFAINNGYSVCWDGDVSEKLFSSRKLGYAIVPVIDWEDKTKKEQEADIEEPVEEKAITQELRQITFDNFTTTDDHLMHIVGIAHDQVGTKFYLTKNSAGIKDRKNDGYVYMSQSYVRLKTTALMVHKDAIPKKIRKKLNLK